MTKLRRNLKRFLLWLYTRRSPRRLVIGAGRTSYSGWIASDIDTLNMLERSDWLIYFKPNSIDALLAEHVWEHLSESAGLQAARLCFEFLKKDGYLRVAVPDGLHPDPVYREHVRPGGTGAGAQDHKILYTYKSLEALLRKAGFEPRFLEYFDETGKFHAADWDSQTGHISRSARFDARNQNGQLKYTSLIVDAIKR